MIPKRIQRKRTKGWKMPPNTVYVGRPTQWGNPYRVAKTAPQVGEFETASEAVAAYGAYIRANLACSTERFRLPITKLRGKNLACFCPLDQPCHADVLLQIANAPEVQP